MNIFQYQFSERLLIIDKSTDPISHARLVYELEKTKLQNSIFDIERMIPTNEYFINIFRHHAGLKSLTNILFAKPRKGPNELLLKINSLRECFYTTIKLIDRFNSSLSTSLILRYFKDLDSLKAISSKGLEDRYLKKSLEVISNDNIRCTIISMLEDIYSVPLFQDDECKGKTEVDLSVFVHCNIPVFLYTPVVGLANNIHDKLLSTHLKSALKNDHYSITPEIKQVLIKLQKDIDKLNEEDIVPFKTPQKANLEYMMDY